MQTKSILKFGRRPQKISNLEDDLNIVKYGRPQKMLKIQIGRRPEKCLNLEDDLNFSNFKFRQYFFKLGQYQVTYQKSNFQLA